MKTRTTLRLLGLLLLSGSFTLAHGAPVALDTTNSQNGVVQIYSATFDGATSPCSGASPSYCPFFGGDPPVTRNITIVPSPTGVLNAVPGGISPVPAAGSSLDLTLSPAHDQLTLAGGTVALPVLAIVIDQGTPDETNIVATGAGMVFGAPGAAIGGALTPAGGGSTGDTVPVDANGVAVFEVNRSPAVTVDFSTLSIVVTSCTGHLCGLIGVLTLDMVKYRLVIDYDATFSTFTASFIGQTANNSQVYANLISADRMVSFGSVGQGQQADQTLTVSNASNATLNVGQIGAVDSLNPPFSVVTDGCSNHALMPNASCNVTLRFAPSALGDFSDSLDIPTDDPDKPSITIDVTGTGVIAVQDVSVATDVQFGDVIASSAFADRSVSVINAGSADLILGNVGVADPLAAPYAIATDTCSGQTIAPTASCAVTVRFSPDTLQGFDDSFDIPSNDPDQPTVTVMVHGTGIETPVNPVTTPIPSGANPGIFGSSADPVTLLVLALFGVVVNRRARR